jgi:cytochrome c biogenesis protein
MNSSATYTQALHAHGWITAGWLRRLASARLTLVIIVLLALGVIAYEPAAGRGGWLVVTPLTLGAINLIAAILTNGELRQHAALLMFHFALLAIVVLAAAGRLTYLKGQLELAEGETFSGHLTQFDSGPWHRSRLQQAAFRNDGYSIRYAKGVKRAETRNAVYWQDEAGQAQQAVIGDHTPLTRHGYRFYTSFNKGFAPVFVWHPHDGAPQRGSINLPSYPIHEYRQALDWTLPGTQINVWTMLQFDEVLLNPERPSQLRLPSQHTLIVRIGEARQVLTPGTRIALPQGVLTYERLTMWMGYSVFYDWTLPWLTAACVLAVVALAGHFWQKFAAQPWDG